MLPVHDMTHLYLSFLSCGRNKSDKLQQKTSELTLLKSISVKILVLLYQGIPGFYCETKKTDFVIKRKLKCVLFILTFLYNWQPANVLILTTEFEYVKISRQSSV